MYHARITEWPESERPREKLLSRGAHTLSDAELLALLIGSGTGGVTAVDVAKKMLIDHRDLARLAGISAQELIRLKGIGPARGARILAAFEMGRRMDTVSVQTRFKVTTPEDLARIYLPKFRDLRQEHFTVILLDSGNRIIRDVCISQGTLTASLVHPREVFKPAVDYLAAGIILAHNHPSGESRPSEEDKKITQQLYEAGMMMGIPVLDHFIFARNQYYSFASHGFFKT